MSSSIQLLPSTLPHARYAWKKLNGIIMVHKRSGLSYTHMRSAIQHKLCEELNSMPSGEEPSKYVEIIGSTMERMNVRMRDSYANHPLVAGPRYHQDDIRLSAANKLNKNSSGLLVFGINDGNGIIHKLKASGLTKVYKIEGLLGQATDNHFINGTIIEKSTYRHVKQSIMDNICASFQSAHQRKMFEFCGVDIQSQAAYELALKGPIRTVAQGVPMLYSIKCTNFKPPNFTLEITCVNEDGEYLAELIHTIGLRLNSTAVCTKIHCIQYAVFTLNSALTLCQVSLKSIFHQIQQCRHLLMANPNLLNQTDPALLQPTLQAEEYT